ncbi:MAG: hypothetical protein C5B54_05085 [Acidobacteria bacterium]|nr:MAG: hypothetical protein C5B54_05085 [Acidobacteriota bacterium]
MPAYSSSAIKKPQMLVGRNIAVWANEAVTAGSASERISLNRDPNLPAVLSVEVKFAADPGAFQIDVQTADTDSEVYYITKASLSSGLNSSFVGRVEFTNIVATYVRLKMITKTNAVNVTATLF